MTHKTLTTSLSNLDSRDLSNLKDAYYAIADNIATLRNLMLEATQQNPYSRELENEYRAAHRTFVEFSKMKLGKIL